MEGLELEAWEKYFNSNKISVDVDALREMRQLMEEMLRYVYPSGDVKINSRKLKAYGRRIVRIY
jgi:ribosome biogenesis GTPase A